MHAVRHLVPRICSAFFTALGGLVLFSPAARALPVNGTMQFTVALGVGAPGVSDSDSATWNGGSPGALSVNTGYTVDADTVNHDASYAGAVFGRGQATWAADGNSGAITLDYGWSGGAGFSGLGYTPVITSDGGPNWEYDFVADQTGNFTLNYDIVASGYSNFGQSGIPYFGLQGYMIYQGAGTGPGAYMLDLRNFDPSAGGQYVIPVVAGSFYSIHIANGGNISGGWNPYFSPAGPTDVSVHAEFSWTLPGAPVAPVPEGGAVAGYLLAGMGAMLGLGRWKRRMA